MGFILSSQADSVVRMEKWEEKFEKERRKKHIENGNDEHDPHEEESFSWKGFLQLREIALA